MTQEEYVNSYINEFNDLQPPMSGAARPPATSISKPTPEMDIILKKIEGLQSTAATLLTAASGLGDRIYGAQPESGEENTRPSPSNGVLAQMHDAIERVHSTLSAAVAAMDRLGRL